MYCPAMMGVVLISFFIFLIAIIVFDIFVLLRIS